MRDVMLIDTSDYKKHFVRFDGPIFDGVLKTYLYSC
jgi:hypothetical protein